MTDWLIAHYDLLRGLHSLAVIAWMAGLLYLPRLFVYHAMAPIGSDRSATFKIMERRLQRGIMTPAMIATWVFGLMLATTAGLVDWRTGWIWAKLALVVALSAFHMALARWRDAFNTNSNIHSARFFRIVNELPTLALIAIVILVVVKPF